MSEMELAWRREKTKICPTGRTASDPIDWGPGMGNRNSKCVHLYMFVLPLICSQKLVSLILHLRTILS